MGGEVITSSIFSSTAALAYSIVVVQRALTFTIVDAMKRHRFFSVATSWLTPAFQAIGSRSPELGVCNKSGHEIFFSVELQAQVLAACIAAWKPSRVALLLRNAKTSTLVISG